MSDSTRSNEIPTWCFVLFFIFLLALIVFGLPAFLLLWGKYLDWLWEAMK